MSIKTNHAAGEPILAADFNDVNAAVIQNQHNAFELALDNFFNNIITPVNGLFFDGMSDVSKADFGGGRTDGKINLAAREFTFDENTLPLGDGGDGDTIITGVELVDATKIDIDAQSVSGQKVINVSSEAGFSIGDKIFVIQTTDSTATEADPKQAGLWEIGVINAIASGTLTIVSNLINTYEAAGAQVIKLKEYNSLTVNAGGDVTCDTWNGLVGGVCVFLCKGDVILNGGGKINAKGLGYRKGTPSLSVGQSNAGEGLTGTNPSQNTVNKTGAGGGNSPSPSEHGYGGGGGHKTAGGTGGKVGTGQGGIGGTVVDSTTNGTERIYFGGAGSPFSGGVSNAADDGRNGGGIITFSCVNLTINSGAIDADGISTGFRGGAGAGGSVLIFANISIVAGATNITAIGGTAVTQFGGNPFGGDGLINLITVSVSGTTDPTFVVPSLQLEALYFSNLNQFQQDVENATIWVERAIAVRQTFDLAVSVGASTIQIDGDVTGLYADTDTIDLYNTTNTKRERFTISGSPSFSGGKTTITLSVVTVNSYTTNDFVERVDAIPTLSIVEVDAVESFNALTFQRSIVDFANLRVEDEYKFSTGTPNNDVVIKITLNRNSAGVLTFLKKYGVALSV